MFVFNSLFYYPLITEQLGCEIALTTGSVGPLYFQVIVFIVQILR